MASPSSMFSSTDTTGPDTARVSPEPEPADGVAQPQGDAEEAEGEITTEMLFESLTAIEHIPEMLAHIPPIMRSLVSDSQDVDVRSHSTEYFETLNTIQVTLRQVVRHLREQKASPSILQAAANNAPSTAFATAENASGRPELGLYASRIEARALGDLKGALERC